jgi:hypothetical protein
MTAQTPDSLINRHPRVRFNKLALYHVVRGDIHRKDSGGWGDGCAYRARAVVPEDVNRSTGLWRGYVATFVLERDGRLRLRSFKFRIARTSRSQRVNEFIEGDFWMVLKRQFFAERTYVPFRDGIIVEDRSQWFTEESHKLRRKREDREHRAMLARKKEASKPVWPRVHDIASEISNTPSFREAEWWPTLRRIQNWLEFYIEKKESGWGRLAAVISERLSDSPELKRSAVGQRLVELVAQMKDVAAYIRGTADQPDTPEPE